MHSFSYGAWGVGRGAWGVGRGVFAANLGAVQLHHGHGALVSESSLSYVVGSI